MTHSWLLFHTDKLHYGTAIFSEIHLCELEFSFDIFRYLVKYSSVPCHEETELFFAAGHRQFLCVSTGWHWLFLLIHHIGWYLRYWLMYEHLLKNWQFSRTHSRITTQAAHVTSLSIFVNKNRVLSGVLNMGGLYVTISIVRDPRSVTGMMDTRSCLANGNDISVLICARCDLSRCVTAQHNSSWCISPEAYELWHPHNWPVTTTNHHPAHLANYLEHQRVSLSVYITAPGKPLTNKFICILL